ncbi:IclR family transcriptional regulator [Orrella marina]|uniref:IclR family transcriptional regulator n=1 Tax=Orrella marina TaxID=2163011 RepID=A0A2R4XH80_9BURK|nr:IclR family transcriptional regulator C-terminal domain-containing protein [Orrella marina]AWB33160.1 IclR family transcriptional regulator [Orrella marina]
MKGREMSSFAKGLSILELFREGALSVHLDEVVEFLGTSRATAYRYLASLCDVGLLSPAKGGVYVLGPRIIELDRIMQIGDPLLTAGRKVMRQLSDAKCLNMLLASYFRNSIMCVDIAWPDPAIPALFERGKPMSLFRGAMAKIILANLSVYQQRNLALNYPDEIKRAGMGETWPEFRTKLAEIGRQGYSITRAEMMPQSGGISAPIFDAENKVLGSITIVLAESEFPSTDFDQLAQWITDAGRKASEMIAERCAEPVHATAKIKTSDKKISTTKRKKGVT